jgi:hypothetical protein
MSFATVLYNAANSGGLNRNNNNWYEKMSILYREKGVIFQTTPEWCNVLAIRHFTPVKIENAYGKFDDAILVAWSDGYKGSRLMVQGFPANTDPSYQYMDGRDKSIKPKGDSIGAHGDDDGKLDLGMLPVGAYEYHTKLLPAGNKVLGNVFKPYVQDETNKLGSRVQRDINRDGYFTEADEKLVKNQDEMYEKYTMYIHRASKSVNPDNTWSAGCQSMRFEDFNKFAEIIAKGKDKGQKRFTYLLVNNW